ncbi:acetolactate synthase small subunit [Desulfonema ishimotonii]|uniref:Acetolactate synthase small subunit n=2 Tax=Desulfonema ishimotonii TaxID=45657 RepID=A0A401FY73_9BACT|nr:acetolactate synthase small subunit [Desulfonema ishimotonii]
MKRRAILAFMLDRPGVLNKIAMLIRRKMYNVDTLTVCSTNKPGVSRMTITLREDDEARVTQVIRQIEKVTEVVSAKELNRDESYWREVAIIKLETDGERLEALRKKYNFEILDRRNHELYIVQVAGTTWSIDDFLAEVGRDRIIEIARTGVTAMEN